MTRSLRTSRIVVLGAGLAGLTVALRLAPRPVLLVSPEPLGQGASSAWAQGGVAAALGAGDSAALHVADTLRAGAGLSDAGIAALVAERAGAHIRALADLGVPFDRDSGGGFALSREAAHSAARVARVLGDQAGAAIIAALVAAVRRAPHLEIAEGLVADQLVVSDGAVCGVQLSGLRGGPVAVMTPAVVLAAGGAAGLFACTTNPRRICGQGIGLAARAGAHVADAEFVQFHPTALACTLDPAPLLTEALRGEGAVLINRDGHRFMADLHPDAELAPRDVVARAIHAQTTAGLAPALDTRAAIGGHLLIRFPAVSEACRRAGIDPVRQPIPVMAAAHYHMGGVATDARGRSSLPGLWVVGEAACTGLHGANRLASNSLAEALVLAAAAAEDLAHLPSPAPAPRLDFVAEPRPSCPDAAGLVALRRCMTDHVGLLRDADGLTQAGRLLHRLSHSAVTQGFRNSLAAAHLITVAAQRRCESRGSHFRTDFPQADPAQAHRRMLTLAEVAPHLTEKEDRPCCRIC